MEGVAVIGRLGIGDVWVGLNQGADGFRLVFGSPMNPAVHTSPAEGDERTDELLSAAIAYFEESLGAPPSELEATQGDLGDLVRWLAADAADPARRRSMIEALDAIDDGLAGDVVVARLAGARGPSAQEPNEQADVVDLLVTRYRALSAPGD